MSAKPIVNNHNLDVVNKLLDIMNRIDKNALPPEQQWSEKEEQFLLQLRLEAFNLR